MYEMHLPEDGTPTSPALITNGADGVVLSWGYETASGAPGTPHQVMTYIATVSSAGGVTVTSGPRLPAQYYPIAPMLQREDGTFVGLAWTGDEWDYQRDKHMAAFGASGNVLWSVPNEEPLAALEDGGVIGKSGIVYDRNGVATDQVQPYTYSWSGNAYHTGSLQHVVANALHYALGFWPLQGANHSVNKSAHFRKDSIANDKVRSMLNRRFWETFARSNCHAVLAHWRGLTMLIPSYSLEMVQKKQEFTNFYDLGNEGVGALTLKEVTAGGIQETFCSPTT